MLSAVRLLHGAVVMLFTQGSRLQRNSRQELTVDQLCEMRFLGRSKPVLCQGRQSIKKPEAQSLVCLPSDTPELSSRCTSWISVRVAKAARALAEAKTLLCHSAKRFSWRRCEWSRKESSWSSRVTFTKRSLVEVGI